MYFIKCQLLVSTVISLLNFFMGFKVVCFKNVDYVELR